jgi:hypothetical protein
VRTGPWDDETCRAIAQSLSALRGVDPNILTNLNTAARNAAVVWAKVGADIQKSLSVFSQNFNAIQSTWKSAFSAFEGVFAEISEQNRKAKLIEGTGWLPHRTTPWAIIGEVENDLSDLSARISKFYCDNWDVIAADLSMNIASYDLDQEAKDTFGEALKAHRLGLYRVAPRLLFPELERVGADEFHDGRHAVETMNGKNVGIASLKDIRESFDTMPAGAILRFEQSLALFGKLQDHLYKKAESDEAIRQIENDPVPNRHASVHGIVAYRTQQTSLNAIIMTDFMFHLMDRLKFHVESGGD